MDDEDDPYRLTRIKLQNNTNLTGLMVNLYQDAYRNCKNEYSETGYKSILNYLQEIENDNGFLAVYYQGNLLAFGIENIYGDFGENGEISEIVVSQQAKNKGVGKFLFKTILYSLEQRGCKEIFLEVGKQNYKALNFYKNIGFEITDQDDIWFTMEYKSNINKSNINIDNIENNIRYNNINHSERDKKMNVKQNI